MKHQPIISSAVILSVFLILLACSNDKNPAQPGGTENMGTTVTILEAAYTMPAAATISVTIPAHIKCAGSTPTSVADSTKQGPCSQPSADSLYLSLSVLMAGVSAIPTIDSATLATFNGVLSSPMIAGRQMDGVFIRAGAGSGLLGIWAFIGIKLDAVIQAIIDANPSLKSQVDSTIGVLTGQANNRVLFLDIAADSITVLIEKGWYGQQMVMGITDTTQYGITVGKPDVSHWQLQGKTSGEAVSIVIDAAGDLDYTSSNTASAAYTYHLYPALCPNDQAPAWWSTFLSANPRQ